MIHHQLAREKAENIISMYKIVDAPVDIEKIANLLGFTVVPFNFPYEVSAVIRINGNTKVIGVNEKHPDVRRRFSIAHELGHYLSGHENFSHEKKIVVDSQKKYQDPQYQAEQEADEFAAELLMPQPMLKNDVLVNKLESEALAEKYKVSEQAMIIQLINHQLTPNSMNYF